MSTRSVGIFTVVALASFGLSACGSREPFTLTTEVVATDFRTLPPPTTTLPPTTTTPPEPGSILPTEATYVVVAGDYPFVVASRFGVDFDEFVALNGWTIEDGAVPDWPEPGATIRIPAGATVPEGPSVLVAVAPDPNAPDSSDPATSDPATGDSATGTSTAVDDGQGCGTYTIVAGDYLGRVATKLDTTVEKLAAANANTDGYGAFYVGLKINIPC